MTINVRIFTVAIVAALIVGAVAGRLSAAPAGPGTPGTIATPVVPAGMPFSINGTVVSIGASMLVVHGTLPGKAQPQDISVSVGTGTVVVVQEQKDPAVFAQEMSAYQSSGKSPDPATSVPPPLPFSERSASLGDITAQSLVAIVTTPDSPRQGTLQAARITVLPAPPAVPPLPAGH